MYHDVYIHDVNESGFLRKRDLPYKMKADVFEEHVLHISNYLDLHNLPKDHVIFTFDDGGKSFYSIVAPVLEKYGLKGLFFVTTKYIGTATFLNEAEIRELHNRGHIIGSHAHTHEHLYTLAANEVEQEWAQSIKILSDILGVPIEYASIPNGDSSKRVLQYAEKCGIKHIYTSEPTTIVSKCNDMDVKGRYVLLADSSVDYVMSIISSPKKRFCLSCKRAFLKMIKKLLGSSYVKLKNFLFRV